MSKNATTIFTIIIIILLGVWAFSAFGDTEDSQPPASNTADQQSTTTTDEPTDASADNQSNDPVPATTQDESSDVTTVEHTEDGFTPQTVEVSQGETVRFISQASGPMWIGSDAHPTHTEYDGTTLQEHCKDGGETFDQCGQADSFTFTFDKVGEWGYHNHVNPAQSGTVIVTN